MKRALLLVAAVVLAGAAPVAAAPPAATCGGVTAKADTFATAGPGGAYWLENMGFDGRGGMWVSQLVLGTVVRYDAMGRPGPSVMVESPGATLLGADRRMYAMFGDSPAGQAAGVVRYDPAAAAQVATPYADGLKMANGAAFDPAGNLYVADTVNGLVAKVTPDGKADPGWLAAPGADGVVRIGETLYVTEFSDSLSTILAVPLADPGAAKPLAALSTGAADAKFLDDLDVGPDGALYVASNRGELIRVDPRDGSACVLLSGLPMVDSVRFAKAFPPFGDDDAFLTSQSGTITHARLTFAEPARLPKIRLRLRPKRVRDGDTVRLRVRVLSPPPCRGRVLVDDHATNRRGRTSFRVQFTGRGRHTFVATKTGCRDGRFVVRVRAAGP